MKKQTGYIKIVLVVFAVIIGLLIFPFKQPAPQTPASSTQCVAGHSPTDNKILRLPVPTYGQTKVYNDTEENISWGPPNPDQIDEYVFIRSNVLTPNEETTKGWQIFGQYPLEGRAHLIPVGENPQKPGYDMYYPTSAAEFLFPISQIGQAHLRIEELVLFRNQDPSTVKLFDSKVYYSVDVYQRKEKFDNPGKGYKTEDLFFCSPKGPQEPTKTTVTIPPQDVSKSRDQLQLEWFLFQEGGGGVWGVHCKPAVYLYPERKKLINVKVYPRGELSYTEPFYDPDKGWIVKANPDGRLLTMNDKPITNNYLYYESKILDSEIKKPVNGWSVRNDELESLFNKVLPQLGLNQKEKRDFMDYWLTKLPKSPYYFVGLIKKAQRDYLEPLQVTPDPDTSIRFSLFFEPLNEPIFVTEPIIQTPQRNGFTLVDWGGMIKLHPGTPFTCSQ